MTTNGGCVCARVCFTVKQQGWGCHFIFRWICSPLVHQSWCQLFTFQPSVCRSFQIQGDCRQTVFIIVQRQSAMGGLNRTESGSLIYVRIWTLSGLRDRAGDPLLVWPFCACARACAHARLCVWLLHWLCVQQLTLNDDLSPTFLSVSPGREVLAFLFFICN